MAFILQLKDGVDTIDFMSSDFKLEDGGLQIAPPEKVQTWTDPSSMGGSKLVDSRNGNRTVTITFHVAGATRQDIRAGIDRINAILFQAVQHSLGKGDRRVSLRYAWDGADVVDNFEVFSGELVLPDDVLSVEKLHSTWSNGEYRVRECVLTLTVSPNAYGQSPSTGDMVELPLHNKHGFAVLGGIQVDPFADPRPIILPDLIYMDNSVSIMASDIHGDAPAKARIEIYSDTTYLRVEDFIIGANVGVGRIAPFATRDTDRVNMLLPGTGILSTFVPGGSYWKHTPSQGPALPGGGSNLILLDKNKSYDLVRVALFNPNDFGTRRYRVLFNAGDPSIPIPKGLKMQVSVRTEHGIVLSQGPITEQTNDPTFPSIVGGGSNYLSLVQDLGVIQLPPASPKLKNLEKLYVVVTLLGAPTDYTISFNSLEFIPTDGGYRVIHFPYSVEKYMAGKVILVDDAWNGVTYLKSNPQGKELQVPQAMFSPIRIVPGQNNHIQFRFFGGRYRPQIGPSPFRVRVFYSPTYTGAV